MFDLPHTPICQEIYHTKEIFPLKSVEIVEESLESLATPAEFDKVGAVWLAWSFNQAKNGFFYNETQLAIINALGPKNRVKLAVKDQKDLNVVQQIVKERCQFDDHVSYHIIPTSTIWIRDTGPSFKRTREGMAVVKFGFNQWGFSQDPSDPEEQWDQEVANQIADDLSYPIQEITIISEGGNREINGRGTLLVVEAVEKARNPNKTKEEIEEEYFRALEVKKVIWLKEGIYEDDNPIFGLLPNAAGNKEIYTPLTPGGHIDLFCRFASPNTILLAEVDAEDAANCSIARENARRLEENFKILKEATDQNGQPFTIIRMPAANPIFNTFEPGDMFYDFIAKIKFNPTEAFPSGSFPEKESYPFVLGASYLNFLICNDVVLTASYWRDGLSEKIKKKDQKAIRTLQEVFPEKEIHSIDVYNVNLAGGGIHCMTLYEPAE